MKKNLTEIILIVDTSGSMSSCLKDAVGGINTFIKQQKEVPTEARLTLVEFSDLVRTKVNNVPLKSMGEYSMVPLGGTALFDAIGKTFKSVGERLAKTPESERPELVLVAIVTDGGENSSRTFETKEEIKKIVEHQEQVYKWQVSYLGANQDGFTEGQSLGVSSSVSYQNDNPMAAYLATSSKFLRMRGMAMNGEEVVNSYNTQEMERLGKKP